jgi:hypothetical protein
MAAFGRQNNRKNELMKKILRWYGLGLIITAIIDGGGIFYYTKNQDSIKIKSLETKVIEHERKISVIDQRFDLLKEQISSIKLDTQMIKHYLLVEKRK